MYNKLRNMKHYKVIAIGGMISVGKSVLVEELSSVPNSEIVYEIEKNDSLTHLFLDWHQGSKSPIASTMFQVYFLTRCYLNHRNALFRVNPNTKWVFLDRTILEHIMFTKHYKSIDIDVYHKMWKPAWVNYIKKLHEYDHCPDLYILLEGDVSTLFHRLVLRNRKEEMHNYQQLISSFVRTTKLYIEKMKKVLDEEGIPYHVINTNDLSKKEVLHETLKILGINKTSLLKQKE